MRDTSEFTLADMSRADYIEDHSDWLAELGLAFAVEEKWWDKGDASVGIGAGWHVDLECIGARLTCHDAIALTREQVSNLMGKDRLRKIEREAAARYAERLA
jgi:hypothetical protein